MADKISITFDDENRIRVLEADKFKDTETMRNDSMEFIKSTFIIYSETLIPYYFPEILTFDETISSIVEVLENQSKKVELEKLRVRFLSATLRYSSRI